MNAFSQYRAWSIGLACLLLVVGLQAGGARAADGQIAGVANDDCLNALPLIGEGPFPFDNTTAIPDGPDHPACEEYGE